jgi:hypothetical protein
VEVNRTRFLVTIGLISILPSTLVESARAQTLSVGVRAGPSGAYTLFEVEAQEAREPRGGILAGGILGYSLRPWLAIQTELLFTQKGWGGYAREGGMRVSYLELPILLRLQHTGRLQPHLLAGPSLALEVGCSFDEEPRTGRVDCDHSLISLERPTIDLGLMIGGGVARSLGPGDVDLDLLLSLGTRDVIQEPLPWGAQTNLAFSLSIAYTVTLGRTEGGDR